MCRREDVAMFSRRLAALRYDSRPDVFALPSIVSHREPDLGGQLLRRLPAVSNSNLHGICWRWYEVRNRVEGAPQAFRAGCALRTEARGHISGFPPEQ